MNSRIIKTREIIWRNKKKSALTVVLSIYGSKLLISRIKDDEVRRRYAEKAKFYGLETVSPTERLRRVTVLVNREARGRKAAQLFEKNALPLLQLAGLDVNVVQVKSQVEMEQIAGVIDQKEADCIYLVGGDGTLCRFLTGMFNNGKEANLPIALFPGGQRNKAFTKLMAFQRKIDSNNIVHLCCQSAMSLIENSQQIVYPIKCTIKPIASKKQVIKDDSIVVLPTQSTAEHPSAYWLLSECTASWFEHFEQKVPKFWWMGPLKEFFVCTWELLKNRPDPLRVEVAYEAYCKGCSKCVKLPEVKNRTGLLAWISWLTGLSYGEKIDPKLLQLATIENPECGAVHVLALSGTDIRIVAQQAEGQSKVQVHLGLTIGRFGTLREAWRRAAQETAHSSTISLLQIEDQQSELSGDALNLGSEFDAQRVRMRFTQLPKNIQKLAISGEWMDFDDEANKEVVMEGTRHPIHIFVSKKGGISTQL